MSGNRWSARLKGRAWRPWNGCSLFDRVIDGRVRELDRQRWRRGRQRGAHRGGGHADRAEIIGLVVRGVVWCRAIALRRGDGRDQRAGSLSARPVEGMNVTEGQGQIDGKRDQRKPRTLTDMITKPAHSEPDRRLLQPPTGERSYLTLLPGQSEAQVAGASSPLEPAARSPLYRPESGYRPDHRSQRRSGFRPIAALAFP